MDKDVHNETLTLQKEASKLLASEMSEIKGGTMSSSCGGSLTKPDQALESEEFSSVMGYNITMNKIKHNLRFVLFILLFFQGTILFSQNTIKGIVCDTDGLAIPYANVLLCLNDSIIAQSICSIIENIPLKGESFSDFIATFAMSVTLFIVFGLATLR